MFQKIEPLVEIVYGAAIGFRLGGGTSGSAFFGDLIHEGIDHRCFAVQHGDCRGIYILRFGGAFHHLIGEAQLYRFPSVHPGFSVHQMGQLGAGQSGLDFVGIDDGVLDAGEHLDGLLHLTCVAHGHGHRVVNHEHGHRRHEDLGTRHSDDGCGGCRDAIDLHRYIVGVVHQHIVDLGRGHAVPAGRVDPDGDIPVPGHQLLLKKLGRDVIVKPAFLGDGAVQIQRPFRRSRLRLRLILPFPKLLHRHFPPFRHRWIQYLQKPPRP